MFAGLARRLGHAADAQFFAEKAAKLRAAYAPTFLNPATGVLAGWKSADGWLHDHEGLLVDNYYALLAVLDDAEAK